MSGRRGYLWAAFNARPAGMPIPPNWFGVAALFLLGAALHPGIWLIGLGLEGLYLWSLSKNPRFRAAVDAEDVDREIEGDSRYRTLLAPLDQPSRERQTAIERQAGEIVELLLRSEAHAAQIDDVRQMAWLHLKLLSARASFLQVMAAATRESTEMEEQERRINSRLAREDLDAELRRSLEQQKNVIGARRAAHADAVRRCELVEAELDRLRQQVSLVREHALLATDENSVAQSLDALSASLNEANRWLKDQRELFGGLEQFSDEPPPAELLAMPQSTPVKPGKRRQRISE
jgi:hypothetical protein